MLSATDNELVTRTGPGTPMGEYLRRFWLPAIVSSEIADPDSPPQRVKIVNENLIAFRDTDGTVGLIAENCPHRGASLFFGRNEEAGLRCVYHGWKFDITGQCVDMPSEPAESNFRTKVRARAYPTLDRGGIVWAYMGPAELQPELPNYEWTLVPDSHRHISRRVQESNFLQGIEGGIDSSHVPFLHGWVDPESQVQAGNTGSPIYMYRDRAPRFYVTKTDYGFVYAAQRTAEADSSYWRITPFMLPFFTIIPGALDKFGDQTYSGHGWVPMDDNNCWMFTYSWNPARPLREREGHPAHLLEREPRTLRSTINRDNDYGIDREVQRTLTYTGIPNGSTQDAAIQESMGSIFDRTQEHLGTSDSAIIYLRRMYLEGARQVLEGGEPRVPADPASFRVRSVSAVLNESVTYDEGRKYVEIGNH